MEKPHLYDVVVDLSTPPSPPSRPSLFASVPANNSARSAAPHRLEQICFTLSELTVWSHIQAALSSLDTSEHFREVVELVRDVPVDWSEAIWMALIKFWSLLRPHGIRLTGSDSDGRTPSESVRPPGQEDDNSPPHSPRSALLLLDRCADREDSSLASRQTIHNIVEVIRRHIASFEARASFYSPTMTNGGSPHIKLLPWDIGSFDLNPLSSGDAEFCRTLVMANLRRRGLLDGAGEAVQSIDVQVTRTWGYKLAWLLGWS
jgi:hypothetical protein